MITYSGDRTLIDADVAIATRVSQQGSVIKSGSRSGIGRRPPGCERRIERYLGRYDFSRIGDVEDEVLNIDCQSCWRSATLLPINRSAGQVIVDRETGSGGAVVDVTTTIQGWRLRLSVGSVIIRDPDCGVVLSSC